MQRERTGIILHKGNLCEELVSTATVLNVHETVGIQRAGPATVSTCNVRFETVRLGLDIEEAPFWLCGWDTEDGIARRYGVRGS